LEWILFYYFISDRIKKIIRIKFTFGGKKNFRIGNIPFPGFLERTSDIERGSGLQPRQLISRLEAAPTKGMSNRNLNFPDMRISLIDFFSEISVYPLAIITHLAAADWAFFVSSKNKE